jgi:hypothetical protein
MAKKETVAKSAKTGKIVSKEFAKANPDTTYETKKPAKKKVVEPARYTPMVGEMCDMSGAIITIQCFDPFEATEFYSMNGCVCDRPFTEPDFDNVRPIDRTEFLERMG